MQSRGAKSQKTTSIFHDKPAKEYHKLPKQLHRMVSSFLGYKETTKASLICKGGGFFRGIDTADFIKSLQVADIPKESATNDEWISFLFRERTIQTRYQSLLCELTQEFNWRSTKHSLQMRGIYNILNVMSLLFLLIGIFSHKVIGSISEDRDVAMRAGNMSTERIGLIVIALLATISSSYLAEEVIGPSKFAKPQTLQIVEDRFKILDKYHDKFRQILAEKGVHLPAAMNRLFKDPFKIIYMLFVLLSDHNLDLKKLNIEIDAETRMGLLTYCIPFCDAKASGGKYLSQRFMHLIDQMQWNMNKDIHFTSSESLPITDSVSAIELFPTETELQKTLFEEFRHFVTRKEIRP